MDAVLVPFIVENPYTILLVLGVLKVIAKATPWALDNEILQVFTGITQIKK